MSSYFLSSDVFLPKAYSLDKNDKTKSANKNILTLTNVISSALRNHPLMKATEEQIEQAKGELLSAQGAFDPAVKAETNGYLIGDYSGSYQNFGIDLPLQTWGSRIGAGYRRGGGSFPIYDNFYETNNSGEIQAGVEVPLLQNRDIDKRRATIEQAVLEKVIATNNIEQRRIELQKVTTMLYWDWIAAKKKKDIYQEILKIAEIRNNQIQERVKSGDLPEFDLVDNQRAVLQRKTQVLSMESLIRKADFELSLVYRDDEGNPINVESMNTPQELNNDIKIEIRDVNLNISNALNDRPELKKILQQLKQNEIEQNLTKNQLLPKLDLQSVVSKDLGEGSSTRDEGEIKTGIKFEVPLFMRTQRGKLEKLESKERELTAIKTFTEQRVSTDVQDALVAIEIAEKKLKIAKEEVKYAKTLEQGESTRFDLGDSNLIFINIREQATADAKTREIDAIVDLNKALGSFEAALGKRISL